MNTKTFIENLIVSALVLGIASWFLWTATAVGQPQPRVGLEADPEWLLLEFENGSQWYFRSASVQAVWAIPDQESKKLGYKSVLFGTGFKINSPYTLRETELQLFRGKANAMLEQLQDAELELEGEK
jgi:hypothetical protein